MARSSRLARTPGSVSMPGLAGSCLPRCLYACLQASSSPSSVSRGWVLSVLAARSLLDPFSDAYLFTVDAGGNAGQLSALAMSVGCYGSNAQARPLPAIHSLTSWAENMGSSGTSCGTVL